MLCNLMVKGYFSAIAASFNPAVGWDWPKAALFLGCGKLHALGSGYFPWLASPSLLR
jgi:hypothetical protein